MAFSCIVRLMVFLGLAVSATAQTILLTPNTTVLSATGGNVIFTATFSYTTLPSTLGITINLPTGWSYVSGTTVPGTSPAEPAVAPSAGRTGQLEWAFITPPASPATFTFTTAYPGTATGLQALTPTTIARDTAGSPATTVTAPAYNLSAPSNIVTWSGVTGSWTDPTQWTSSTVPANSGATRFSATVAAGVASLNTAVTIDNLTFTGGVINGTGNLGLSGLGSTWTGGTFGGASELVIGAGAQFTASGASVHLFNDRTIRNEGTFSWVDQGALQSGNGGAFINSAGAKFTDATTGGGNALISNSGTGSFSFTNAGTYSKTAASTTVISVPFSNTGNILISAGTVRFSSTFTQTGGLLDVATGATARFDTPLAFAAGTLRGGGTVVADITNSAFISPGNTLGTLTINGNLTLLGTSHLQFDIAGTSQGTNYDYLAVSGTATLGGNFTFTMALGAENLIGGGATLTLLSSSALSGAFVGIPNGTRLLASSGTGSFILNYGPTSVTLSGFQPIPEPSIWALLLAGVGAVAVATVRRRR